MVPAGSIAALSAALGCGSDEVSVLEAMLVMEENPVTRSCAGELSWEFINSGVDFVFSDSTLSAIGIRLVYDRSGGFNGIAVPSWLVADWHRRPGPADMRRAFGEPVAAGETAREEVRLPEWEALGEVSQRTRPGTLWEVFDLADGVIHADYDDSRTVRTLTLMAEPR
ncbi:MULTISPECIES: hypothetical protein [Brevibacterium]|uniref:Uncharacterized protein n=1 Tax=Brevibacterium pityocampae TaxID=506594 RepID=A0ABP8JHX0_9MICO|nr:MULTISPECIES: hypothetical protein [Actinomycetes]MCK1802679.1 hypothetical protein [Brevibacterium sp. R8603A2]MCX0276216.1 hypothetical protein [Nocardia zapadnayensis]QCP05385.1 hypothetical protein FDF13_08910 [Brevibacterium sp. CS2]